MINQILLDLDGVVIDYVGGCIDWFGLKTHEGVMHEWDSVLKTYKKQTGKSKSDFFREQTEEFWLGLKMYPWASDLLELLAPYKPVILTSPTLTNAGLRQRWINKNMKDYFDEKRYLIGPAKWAAAHPGALLIDDKPDNIRKFSAAGGQVMFFPQPWNVGLVENRFQTFVRAFDILRQTEGVVTKA